MIFYKTCFLIWISCYIRSAAGNCGKTMYTFSSATITSPKPYNRGQSCVYKIQTTFFTSFIKLSWHSFEVDGEMPSCNKDYLEVYSG